MISQEMTAESGQRKEQGKPYTEGWDMLELVMWMISICSFLPSTSSVLTNFKKSIEHFKSSGLDTPPGRLMCTLTLFHSFHSTWLPCPHFGCCLSLDALSCFPFKAPTLPFPRHLLSLIFLLKAFPCLSLLQVVRPVLSGMASITAHVLSRELCISGLCS